METARVRDMPCVDRRKRPTASGNPLSPAGRRSGRSVQPALGCRDAAPDQLDVAISDGSIWNFIMALRLACGVSFRRGIRR